MWYTLAHWFFLALDLLQHFLYVCVCVLIERGTRWMAAGRTTHWRHAAFACVCLTSHLFLLFIMQSVRKCVRFIHHFQDAHRGAKFQCKCNNAVWNPRYDDCNELFIFVYGLVAVQECAKGKATGFCAFYNKCVLAWNVLKGAALYTFYVKKIVAPKFFNVILFRAF